MDNPAGKLIELAKEVNIPTKVIVREILGISRTTLFNWSYCPDKVPAKWVPVLNDLIETLERYRDTGILENRSVEDYVWQGIIHLTECNNPTE